MQLVDLVRQSAAQRCGSLVWCDAKGELSLLNCVPSQIQQQHQIGTVEESSSIRWTIIVVDDSARFALAESEVRLAGWECSSMDSQLSGTSQREVSSAVMIDSR